MISVRPHYRRIGRKKVKVSGYNRKGKKKIHKSHSQRTVPRFDKWTSAKERRLRALEGFNWRIKPEEYKPGESTELIRLRKEKKRVSEIKYPHASFAWVSDKNERDKLRDYERRNKEIQKYIKDQKKIYGSVVFNLKGENLNRIYETGSPKKDKNLFARIEQQHGDNLESIKVVQDPMDKPISRGKKK